MVNRRAIALIPLIGTVMAAVGGSEVSFDASPAGAIQNDCSSVNKSYFDGTAFRPTDAGTANSREGIAGDLTVQYGGVCNTDMNPKTNTSAAWVMVLNNNAGPLGYVQSGHIRWYGSATYPFSQYNEFNGMGDEVSNIGNGALTIGSTYSAKVVLTTGSACGG
ncbi:MAG: hypothetical protein ACLPVY_08950, partial [Acidimicrobiia bacterium]